MEARIDRVTFEYFLIKTLPQHLIMINGSESKVKHMRDFIQANGLKTKLDHVVKRSLLLQSETSVKQVFLDQNLSRHLSMHKV